MHSHSFLPMGPKEPLGRMEEEVGDQDRGERGGVPCGQSAA